MSANDENTPPVVFNTIPPPLLRQEAVGPECFGAFDTGGVVNGQFEPPEFNILVDGYWGYNVEDIETIMREEGWLDSGDEYEKEELSDDSDSDSDDDDTFTPPQ